MLSKNIDALSSAASKVSSDSMVECELEEENDWVVVKKQKITILVPPQSPQRPQGISPVKTKPRITKRCSGAQNKIQPGLTEDKCQELPAMLAPANVSLSLANGIGMSSRAQEAICNPVASPKKLEQQASWSKVIVNGKKGIYEHRKSINVPRFLPIGSLNVVNQRVRAQNLERKLEGVGGLRRWLGSQGLDRYIKVFEREKVGKHQLANLTMRVLKDMMGGIDAVGPRRKLIHAIDSLCQPYYFNALQQ